MASDWLRIGQLSARVTTNGSWIGRLESARTLSGFQLANDSKFESQTIELIQTVQVIQMIRMI